MIKRLKRQLSSSPSLLVLSLFLPLIGFFIYANFYSSRFFIALILSLVVEIGYLVFGYIHLTSRQSALSLEKQDYRERLNLLEAEIQRERQTNEALRQKIASYLQLKELTERLGLSFSLAETAATFCRGIHAVYGGHNNTVILYLFRPHTRELSLTVSFCENNPVLMKAKNGDFYDRWVVKNTKPLLVEDTKNDFRFDAEKISAGDGRMVRSLISAPLLVGEKSIGLVRMDRANERHFTTDDLRFLTTIAGPGAVALENVQLYERVQELAVRDSLTGLFLRRYLMDRLTDEISGHFRRQGAFSFLMIDLDHFKKYNDRFGHTAGDIVLRTVGAMLAEMFRNPADVVCRYGGEEFAVLLPDCPKEKGLELAQQLRKDIEAQTIVLRREKTRITVSVGVAGFPGDAHGRDELIQKADAALYKAKSSGRNRVEEA